MTTTTINRIRFFNTNSHLVRCYGLSQRITVPHLNGEKTYHLSDMPTLRHSGKPSKPLCDFAASDQVRNTIADLLKINGIFWVLVRGFEINVKIENAFDWQDVHEEVIAIMKKHLFANGQVDVQDRTKEEKKPRKEA